MMQQDRGLNASVPLHQGQPVRSTSWLTNMKVSTRLISGFSTIAAMGVFTGLVGLYFLKEINGTLSKLTDVTAPTVETSDDLIANI